MPNSPFKNQENIEDSINMGDEMQSPINTQRNNSRLIVQNMYVRFRRESRMGYSEKDTKSMH